MGAGGLRGRGAPFAGVPGFERLPVNVQRRLDRQVERCTVPAGTLIAARRAAAAWVTFVVEGELVADGGHSPRRLRPGDTIGIPEVLHHLPHPTTWRAAATASLVLMEGRRFTAALATVPEFAALVLHDLTRPEPVPAGLTIGRRRVRHLGVPSPQQSPA